MVIMMIDRLSFILTVSSSCYSLLLVVTVVVVVRLYGVVLIAVFSILTMNVWVSTVVSMLVKL